jgi:hypothetical protein
LLNKEQCDKIGRIFAQWAIVYFGQFLKRYRKSPQSLAAFYQSLDDVLILTKNGLGYIFGRCFHELIWSPRQRAVNDSCMYVSIAMCVDFLYKFY